MENGLKQGDQGPWDAVCAAFSEPEPAQKCQLVKALTAPQAALPAHVSVPDVTCPGRPAAPALVPARKVPRRGLGTLSGRAAFLHAVAHIEFNAINLGLDAILRFPDMPTEYRSDWLSVAKDEARHFQMLTGRLAQLQHAYGDFPAHDGLWQAAVHTAADVMARMAVVPRVLEARGLDVTPAMIERLEAAGDRESAEVLQVILQEEIRHVRLGSQWFGWLCSEQGRDSETAFLECLREYLPRHRFRNLNQQARLAAGFSEGELAALESV